MIGTITGIKTLEAAMAAAIRDGATGYVSFFTKFNNREELFCVDFLDRLVADDKGNLHEAGYWQVDMGVYASNSRLFSASLVGHTDTGCRYSEIILINKETIMAEIGTKSIQINLSATFKEDSNSLEESFGEIPQTEMNLIKKIVESRRQGHAIVEAIESGEMTGRALITLAAVGAKMMRDEHIRKHQERLEAVARILGGSVLKIDLNAPENRGLTKDEIIARERSRIARENNVPESDVIVR